MIEKTSRIKRIKLVGIYVILPLISLFLIVYLTLGWYQKYINKDNNSSNAYIEIENSGIGTKVEVGEINPKEVNNDDKVKEPVKEVVKNDKPKVVTTNNWWEYPKKIYTTTKSGNNLLVLVNKQYRLPSTYAPSDLVLAENSGIRVKSKNTYYVRSILINDLKELNNAAKKDSIDLSVISAYRSYNTQKSTYDYWVKYNNGCVSCADKISARAGHSQHQLGTAVDFSTKDIGDRLGSEFDNTNAAKWLLDNGWKYGFVISYPKGYESVTGYSYESWHYRYIGKNNAIEMKNSGIILEKYLSK